MRKNLNIKSVGLVVVIGLIGFACGDDEPAKDPTPPVISDVKIIEQADTFVSVGFTISNPDGVELQEVGVIYGLKGQELDKNEVSFTNISDADKAVINKITLDSDSEYDFKTYVKYNDKIIESDMLSSFTTSSKWKLLKQFPGNGRMGGVSFAIGDKVYFGLGSDRFGLHVQDNNYKDFWVYDTSLDVWTQLADFPGGSRSLAFAFAVDGKGYVGSGRDPSLPNDGDGKTDFWQFDPANNSWTKKNDLPSPAAPLQFYGLLYPVADAANGIAYYGTGLFRARSGAVDEMYRYNSLSDQWTQVPNYPFEARGFVSFMIGNRLFVGGGNLSPGFPVESDYKFYSLNYLESDWKPVASMPANTLDFYVEGIGSKGFSIGDFGYVVTPGKGLYKYDAASNTWSKESNFVKITNPMEPRYGIIGAVVNGKAYLGLGQSKDVTGNRLEGTKDWAVFDPSK